MPPFARKFVRKCRNRLSSGNYFVVEDVVAVPNLGASGSTAASLDVVPFQSSTPLESSVSDSGNDTGSIDNIAPNLSRGPSDGASRMPLKMVADFIPYFDGKPGSVSKFINQCRLADSLVKKEDKYYLLAIMRNKMQIRDYNRIVGDAVLNTVEELVNLTKVAYKDSFNVKAALDDLRNIERKDGETIEEFGARVHEILDNGIEIAQEKSNPEQVKGVKSVLEEEAVSGFLGSLRDDAMMMSIINQEVEGLAD